jgi:hypothetical protein
VQLILWLAVVLAGCALSYVTQFAGATLSMGRALSETDSGRGFQDAITPPWQTNFALAVHVLVLAILAVVFGNSDGSRVSWLCSRSWLFQLLLDACCRHQTANTFGS